MFQGCSGGVPGVFRECSGFYRHPLKIVTVNDLSYFKSSFHYSFFLLSKLCTFWQHWFANFSFCQREPELPRFFISYHNRSRAKLYNSVYFTSILDIPRPILSLCGLPIFAFFRSRQNAFVSKNHQTI